MNGLTRMTKDGAFMDAYNPKEVARLESKGWTVVPEEKPAPIKKTRKTRARK